MGDGSCVRMGVIFDVDGVLVDSYSAHYESWRMVCGEHGIELTERDFARTFGRTSAEIIAELWPAAVPAEAAVALDRRKEALYRDIVAGEFPGFDGAAELVRELHDAGLALAVGSSGPPENVALVLDRLGVAALFSARVTGFDVTRGKPDPQVFQLAGERLGLGPDSCAVIEDAPVGVAAARSAGMASIGFASTGRTVDDLVAADRVVGSLRELSAPVIRAVVEAHRGG